MSILEKIRRIYSSNDQTTDLEIAGFLARSTAASFLFIHAGLLAVFWYNGVTPMAVFNVLSILCYAYGFRLIRRDRYYSFVLISYLEVIAHMSLAIWMVGWGSGFQIVLIAINLMLFFADYIGRFLGLRPIPSVQLALLCTAMYLLNYIASENFTPPYSLPHRVEFWLHIGWILIVFSISIMVLESFVWMAFSNEATLLVRATRDRLTGLGNRYFITEHLAKLREEHGLEGCWLAILDIDDFKKANDSYGHNCGDYILQKVASIMEECRSFSELARWGGEEFIFVGVTGEDKGFHLRRLEELRMRIADYEFRYEGVNMNTTVTIGVADYRKGQSVRDWINEADKKLYEGKRSGKNKVVY